MKESGRRIKMMNSLKFKNIAAMFFVVAISCFSMLSAQENPEKTEREVNQYLREAEDAMGENDFASAEASYRKAIAKDPSNTAAKYNLGNLYYNKEKTPEAANRLSQAHEISGSKEEKHRINHNLGNSFMKQKKYQEAVEAYKNALRNNPSDEETRYNLALAKKMLEEEQQNQDQDQDQNQDQDQEENQDQQESQDQQNQDGDGGENENQDSQPKDEGENEDKENQDKGDQEDQDQKEQQDEGGENGEEQEEQPQQQQPAQGQLSPQQIQSLLDAMDNEEKKVQDKINAEKAKGVKVKSEKDW
ncbi:tetratricopeptide repeat protein [Autumnicola edwardsiae]|uniref:Tetratricopeptide repeat protein n=1 Tax=Autumnicola edwardsiae TaxID=3075594 RepID=A0ABU3CT69_9FLAO|nr:tetratricopeptide repeat protein [Zunongwangia sp. F297]MDT0649422.1 tetratricopeptide repeat protein [Zunongwangia sp. F297]